VLSDVILYVNGISMKWGEKSRFNRFVESVSYFGRVGFVV